MLLLLLLLSFSVCIGLHNKERHTRCKPCSDIIICYTLHFTMRKHQSLKCRNVHVHILKVSFHFVSTKDTQLVQYPASQSSELQQFQGIKQISMCTNRFVRSLHCTAVQSTVQCSAVHCTALLLQWKFANNRLSHLKQPNNCV